MSQRNRLGYETPNTVSDVMRVMRSAPMFHTFLSQPARKFWNQFPELIHPIKLVSRIQTRGALALDYAGLWFVHHWHMPRRTASLLALLNHGDQVSGLSLHLRSADSAIVLPFSISLSLQESLPASVETMDLSLCSLSISLCAAHRPASDILSFSSSICRASDSS